MFISVCSVAAPSRIVSYRKFSLKIFRNKIKREKNLCSENNNKKKSYRFFCCVSKEDDERKTQKHCTHNRKTRRKNKERKEQERRAKKRYGSTCRTKKLRAICRALMHLIELCIFFEKDCNDEDSYQLPNVFFCFSS